MVPHAARPCAPLRHPLRVAPTTPTRSGVGKVGSIAVSVLVMMVVRAAFRGSSAPESWSEHAAVGGLMIRTPKAFEAGESSGPMKQASQTSSSTFVEAVAIDIPAGSDYDIDAGTTSIMDLVTQRPGNVVSHVVKTHERMLGMAGERCRFDVTHDGVTKPVELRVFCTAIKAYGVIAVADAADLDRIMSSIRLDAGAMLAIPPRP